MPLGGGWLAQKGGERRGGSARSECCLIKIPKSSKPVDRESACVSMMQWCPNLLLMGALKLRAIPHVQRGIRRGAGAEQKYRTLPRRGSKTRLA